MLLIALVPPTAAVAQNLAADQQYCAALLDKYLRYAGVTEYPGTPGKLSNDNQAALAQARCQAGDTDAGIRHPRTQAARRQARPAAALVALRGAGWI